MPSVRNASANIARGPSRSKRHPAIRAIRRAEAARAEGRSKFEGGRHGRKADSGRQIRLSISPDLQAIVAHADLAGAGSGDRLSRSQALHLSSDRRAHRPSRIGPEQDRGPSGRHGWRSRLGQQPVSRGFLRDPDDGRGAADGQCPPVARTDRLYDQSRRRLDTSRQRRVRRVAGRSQAATAEGEDVGRDVGSALAANGKPVLRRRI